MDVELYERALKRTGAVVAGTGRDRLDDPTPCGDWDVRALLNHIIDGCLTFAAGAAGGQGPAPDADHCADDHVAAFEEASRSAVEGFRAPGVMERDLQLPWGETPGSVALGLALAEAAVHGWDLATATGQETTVDADVAEAVYGMTTHMMEPRGPYPRGSAFGPLVEVEPDAPISHRLLGYLGRQP